MSRTGGAGKIGPVVLAAVFAAAAAAAPDSAPDFASDQLALGFSRSAPAFTRFCVDSLGQGKLVENPVRRDPPGDGTLAFAASGPGRFVYTQGGRPAWSVDCTATSILLRSEFAGGVPPPFTLTFDQKANHATLLGRMESGTRRMAIPCVLHLPDLGTLRVTCDTPGVELGYDAVRRIANPPYVRIEFPAATAERPRVAYRLEVAAIHPDLPGIAANPLYDGFRRDWLNIFQVNPRLQMLANNASSDPCAFTLFKYALVARETPPLAHGLTALDLVRMTVNRYLAGELGYGQVGFAMKPGDAILVPWETPWTTTDSYPSLVLAACVCAEAAKDSDWPRANYGKLLGWARAMMARDTDGDGLIEYPSTGNYGDRPKRERRPANWWDTINFGHEDAYSNALIYHAARRFAALARSLGKEADAADFEARADRLRASYAPGFLNPETGLIAGWRSADGQLHDYGFTFVSGAAVTFGLLHGAQANAVMDRLLAKMTEVGYTNFAIGLPGNLLPIRKGDYVNQNEPPEKYGEPRIEDGSDGFQFYENGGATGCFAYFLIKALYTLDRVADARRIFHPMLRGYAAGNFQGFDESGMSRDWRDWKGGGHGYEGLLVDNYLALLAVLDDIKAQ